MHILFVRYTGKRSFPFSPACRWLQMQRHDLSNHIVSWSRLWGEVHVKLPHSKRLESWESIGVHQAVASCSENKWACS